MGCFLTSVHEVFSNDTVEIINKELLSQNKVFRQNFGELLEFTIISMKASAIAGMFFANMANSRNFPNENHKQTEPFCFH